MRGNYHRRAEKSACTVKNSPIPETVVCTQCGGDGEIWTDENEATCSRCGSSLKRNLTFTEAGQPRCEF